MGMIAVKSLLQESEHDRFVLEAADYIVQERCQVEQMKDQVD